MLLMEGVIRYDPEYQEYIGVASDGVEVSFGEESAARLYLAAHPSPADW
jgi:hypothetical protein